MNKSLLIQNGIAGGIAGTVADGLFNNEDEHHYAKSAFMGTLAGVGATALHQSLPSGNKAVKATTTHVANVPPAAPIAPTPQPAAVQPKPAATTPVQQQTAPQQPAAAPIVEQPKPAVVAPQPAAKPIEQPKPKPKPEPEPQPVEKAEATPAPKPIEQPKAVQPVQAEPVQQPAAAPKPEPAPIKITPEEPKQAEPPKAVVPVKPAEEPKQEFVGPKDKPLSRKLTKTINSVKQTASGIGNGITDAAKRLSATASQLKIPPIQINVPQISQNIREKGRTVASGLARSARALSIAAIASMDMGGGHAVVQHAFEAASHSVQVQASMATSTMTKAVNNITEAVGNYHPMQGVENAINDMQYIPMAANDTVAIKPAINRVTGDAFTDDLAERILINKKNNNDPFVVVNTDNRTVSAYDGNAKLVGRTNIDVPDGYTGAKLTPAQIAELRPMQKVKDNTLAIGKMLKKYHANVPVGMSIYSKFFDKKDSNAKLLDTNFMDNNITFDRDAPTDVRYAIGGKSTASFNPTNAQQFREEILNNVGDSPLVAVSSHGNYLGLSSDPMTDQNQKALEIVEKMKPTSNFLVADKKDQLVGLYNPQGSLLDYYPIGLGRDSALSDEFGIAKNAHLFEGKSPEERQKIIDAKRLRSTPAGVFEMKKKHYDNSVESGIGANYSPKKTTTLINAYNGNSPLIFAMHDVSFSQKNGLSQFSNRNYNPYSPTLASNGCVVLDDRVMQNQILPRLNEKTILAVMPNVGDLKVGNAPYKYYKTPTLRQNIEAKIDQYMNPKSPQLTDNAHTNAPTIKPTFLQSAITNATKNYIDKPFKPGVEYRCADSVSSILSDAFKQTGTNPGDFRKTLLAKDFAKMGTKIEPKDIQPGDVITFTNTWRKSKSSDDATHVGIYTGNNMFAHRPSSEDNAFRLSKKGAVVEENVADWLKARKDKNVQIGGIYRMGK